MGGIRRSAGVLDAVAVRVNVQGVESENSSGHALRRRNAPEVVEHVVLLDDVQGLAVLGKGHGLGGPTDLVDLLVADTGVLDLGKA